MRKLTILVTLLICQLGFAEDLTGPQIIEKVNEIINPPQMEAVMTMQIQTSLGEKREFVYKSYSKNHGEKTLMRYLEPARSKGQATLMLNNADDIWAYFPRTKRVRKLAEHAKRQKMESSDFSYEDMGAGDAFLTEYTAVRLADEKINDLDCYKLELKRKDKDASYSKLIMWVDKSNFVTMVIDYYDFHDPELRIKRLKMEDVQVIQGIPTPMKMTMTSVMDNSQTIMTIREVNYNVNLDDNLFTERGLRE